MAGGQRAVRQTQTSWTRFENIETVDGKGRVADSDKQPSGQNDRRHDLKIKSFSVLALKNTLQESCVLIASLNAVIYFCRISPLFISD